MNPAETTVPGRPARRGGIVALGIGLAFFAMLVLAAVFVVLPAYAVRKALASVPRFGISGPDPITRSDVDTATIARLGGPEKAAGRLSLYVNLPERFADDKAAAIYYLGACGRHGARSLARIIDSPKRQDLHRDAAAALKRIGPEAAAAVPTLSRALTHGDYEVRAHAAETLALVGPAAAGAASALIEALDDPDARVRSWSAEALGNGGVRSAGLAGKLAALVGDSQAVVRASAALALVRVNAEAALAVPVLTKALADNYGSVRFAAAVALAGYGPDAREAETSLRKLLEDEAPDVRWAAGEALKAIRGVRATR